MADHADGAELRVEVTSAIAASPDAVWARATTPEGINDELRPWFRMTMPRGLRGKTIDDLEPGARPGRSWLLLFRVLPVDYDDLGIAELGPGNRFLERSSMLSMRRWQHERIVAGEGEAARVTDRLAFELRGPMALLPGSGRLGTAVIGAMFRHRHRRLAAHFRGST